MQRTSMSSTTTIVRASLRGARSISGKCITEAAVVVSLQQRYFVVVAKPRTIATAACSSNQQRMSLPSSVSLNKSNNKRHRAVVPLPTRANFVSPSSIGSCRSFSSSPASPDDSSLPKTTTSSEVATTNANVPALPIDFQVAAKIEGEESHIATIQLRPGEVLRAESGAMLYMTEGIVMDTKLEGASAAFSRMLTGQNVFLTDFRYEGDANKSGTVALGTDFPSKILRFSLQEFPNQNLICQRGAFMAASHPNVQIEMEFTKSMTAGFFGGQGFILQKLSGEGDVLVKGGGTVVRKELEPNETLRVTSGSIIAFESTIQYDVQMMPGIKNAMFGGEGLFVTTLTGPGSVWLQGMPADRMIAEIARRVPSGGPGIGIPIGLGGGGGGVAEGGEGEVAEGDAADVAGGGADEAVAAAAATDAAIDADRQATVATSGMGDYDANVDSESPSALFGDAVPTDDNAAASTATNNDDFANDSLPPDQDDDFSSFASTTTEEPTFMDDDTTSSDTFDDGFSEDFKDGELFDDTATPDSGDASEEGGSSIISTLWDIFTGGDE